MRARIQPFVDYVKLCTGRDYATDLQGVMQAMAKVDAARCLDRVADAEPNRVVHVVMSVSPAQALPAIEQSLTAWDVPVIRLIADNLDGSRDPLSSTFGGTANGAKTVETIANLRLNIEMRINYMSHGVESNPNLPPDNLSAAEVASWRQAMQSNIKTVDNVVRFVGKNGIPIKAIVVRGPAQEVRSLRDQTNWVSSAKISPVFRH